MGRGTFAPLAHANFVSRMAQLRCTISSQGNPIANLLGMIVALAEENDALTQRVVELENKQSGTFTRV